MPVGTLVDQRRRAPRAVVLLVPRELVQALLHGLLRHQRRLEQVADLVAVPATGSGAGKVATAFGYLGPYSVANRVTASHACSRVSAYITSWSADFTRGWSSGACRGRCRACGASHPSGDRVQEAQETGAAATRPYRSRAPVASATLGNTAISGGCGPRRPRSPARDACAASSAPPRLSSGRRRRTPSRRCGRARAGGPRRVTDRGTRSGRDPGTPRTRRPCPAGPRRAMPGAR